MVRYGQGLIDHRTLKSGGFYIWFEELSRLIEWFLHDDGNGIIFWFDRQSILYLWHINAVETAAAALSQNI